VNTEAFLDINKFYFTSVALFVQQSIFCMPTLLNRTSTQVIFVTITTVVAHHRQTTISLTSS